MTDETSKSLAEELAREWREEAVRIEKLRDSSPSWFALKYCAAELLKKFGVS